MHSQISSCGHLAITDTPLLSTGAEVPGNKNYRKILPLLWTLTNYYGPDGVRYNETPSGPRFGVRNRESP